MDWLSTSLPLMALAMMRPLGAMLLTPVFGTAMLGGALIRNALAFMAALPTFPLMLSLALPDPWRQPMAYAGLLAGELTIGVLLGFSVAIPFWAIDAAGHLLDTLRGASMGSVLNPVLGVQSSVLGTLFAQLISTLFLVSSGFHALLTALFDSYLLLPPGQPWTFGTRFLPFLLSDWRTLYTLGLGFAMPGIVIMVLIDLGLGLINRTVQQMNVFSLAMPIKSLAVLLLMLIAMQFCLQGVERQFARLDGGLVHGLQSVSHE
ncbi:type III secretion system export apparatus subunit SctT [Paludibacterium purpuratum]|uniref:Type III secretion protein T n=1 Tax=Paludibacterium purpuratum TaxID=1144873 RepID=A0A4R7B350_9NEIS|nr:type III secretion system export apparatus subunit SctT [Paludibacterium purpuratum]TDR76594.1 type III secretion protein T [Paludibacterium purpuratum]